MRVWIDEHTPELSAYRISVQKSLNLPRMVNPSEMDLAK